jgi:hypothetical protein
MAQQAVDPFWSGSLIAVKDDDPLIEGVRGRGDDFMIGKQGPQHLPDDVRRQVLALFAQARRFFRPVEMEWVFDGNQVWVVQLHATAAVGDAAMIVPGNPARWVSFPVAKGLDAFQALIARARDHDTGIELVGRVGMTSHFGDLLRTAQIPSRLAPDHS